MASSPLTPIVYGIDLTTSFVDIYEVPTDKSGIGIDAAVFNNHTASSARYTIRLIQAGGSSVLNEIITDKQIRPFDSDLAQALIGQALVTGGKIQAKASSNNAISVQITATVLF